MCKDCDVCRTVISHYNSIIETIVIEDKPATCYAFYVKQIDYFNKLIKENERTCAKSVTTVEK